MAHELVKIGKVTFEVHYVYRKGIPGCLDAEFENSFEEEPEEFYLDHVYCCGFDLMNMLDINVLEEIERKVLEKIGE